MSHYKPVAEVHGKYGTTEIKENVPDTMDAATLGLLYNHNYVVKSPSGNTTFHKDWNSAIERAEKSAGRR